MTGELCIIQARLFQNKQLTPKNALLASDERCDYYENYLVRTCSCTGEGCFRVDSKDCSVMNQNPPASTAPDEKLSTPATLRKPLDARALAAALAGIAADSQRQPETYLRDTVVPHGGE
jgi:hypothetical protein